MIFGNRIPRTYFVTDGVGESDITVHAGSYHLALREAGIEMANIITYSSILPGTAEEVSRPSGIVHGEVMETISAESSCHRGERATAGLIWGWLYDSDARYGGLVCEYSGQLSEDDAADQLQLMLNELHENGYEHMELRDIEVRIRSVTPSKSYGTALVAICFTSHEWPEVRSA